MLTSCQQHSSMSETMYHNCTSNLLRTDCGINLTKKGTNSGWYPSTGKSCMELEMWASQAMGMELGQFHKHEVIYFTYKDSNICILKQNDHPTGIDRKNTAKAQRPSYQRLRNLQSLPKWIWIKRQGGHNVMFTADENKQNNFNQRGFKLVVG